jgi:hypothetical protein
MQLANAVSGMPCCLHADLIRAAAAAAGVSGNIVKFDASGDLIPDNKSYQSIRYVAGKVSYGPYLTIPAK